MLPLTNVPRCSQIVGVWFCEQGELQQMDAMLGRIFEMHPSFEASRSGRVGMGASSSAGAAAGAQRQQVGLGPYLCGLQFKIHPAHTQPESHVWSRLSKAFVQLRGRYFCIA